MEAFQDAWSFLYSDYRCMSLYSRHFVRSHDLISTKDGTAQILPGCSLLLSVRRDLAWSEKKQGKRIDACLPACPDRIISTRFRLAWRYGVDVVKGGRARRGFGGGVDFSSLFFCFCCLVLSRTWHYMTACEGQRLSKNAYLEEEGERERFIIVVFFFLVIPDRHLKKTQNGRCCNTLPAQPWEGEESAGLSELLAPTHPCCCSTITADIATGGTCPGVFISSF